MPFGVVTGGPYRYVRHPNYVAVFVELLALPLVHGAYLTAAVGRALHVMILWPPDLARGVGADDRLRDYRQRVRRDSPGSLPWPMS